MAVAPVRALPIEDLRRRTSVKWSAYPDDVLPLFVAETDFPLAPAITETLRRALELGDTGYKPSADGLADAFAGFARRRYAWAADPARIRATADVSMGVVEVLRRVITPGDRVIVMPPVYPPFYDLVAEAGGVVERVPLLASEDGWAIDLAGVSAALAAGARAVLLCNPHNPTGTVHARDALAELARLAVAHGAVVVSDEIHAPLTRPGVAFTPFLSVGPDAEACGFAVVSPSKAFNLAGLKCALMVAAADDTGALLRRLPDEVEWRAGLFGALAAAAALSPQSDPWLDGLLLTLEENRALLTALLAEHLPEARFIEPDAGYLAWIDLTALDWGDDPARRIIRDARVALHFGPTFGDEGRGHVRLNFGTSPEILTEAVRRIGAMRP